MATEEVRAYIGRLMVVVFTDLDGTLLDSRSEWTKAVPALQRLNAMSIPVVLVTSKTFAEVKAIRRAMSNESPFIVENGGALFARPEHVRFPDARRRGEYSVCEFGIPGIRLRQMLVEAALESGCAIRASDQMTLAEWSRETGLSVERAMLEKTRSYDEPFRLVHGDLGKLRRALSWRGARLTRGSRFLHVTGPNDKKTAVSCLLEAYRRSGPIETIGLGDAPNDLGFLRLMDHPVLLDSPFANALHQRIPHARRAAAGPLGWNRSVLDLLSEFKARSV
jgi:mannosyl-3-phosphoglycerate phosphatase